MEKEQESLVTCPKCQKTVPNGNICIVCGGALRELPLPRLSPMEMAILKCLEEGAMSIDDILDCADGTRESVRMVASNLVKFGLAMRPWRGRYALTDAGKSAIEKKVEVVVAKPKERAAIPLFEPQYINRSVAYRLFKSAGYARASAGSIDVLIKILEELGDKIASRAVELTEARGRKTVKVENMEQAIREIIVTREVK